MDQELAELERAAREAPDDTARQLELARSYLRLGERTRAYNAFVRSKVDFDEEFWDLRRALYAEFEPQLPALAAALLASPDPEADAPQVILTDGDRLAPDPLTAEGMWTTSSTRPTEGILGFVGSEVTPEDLEDPCLFLTRPVGGVAARGVLIDAAWFEQLANVGTVIAIDLEGAKLAPGALAALGQLDMLQRLNLSGVQGAEPDALFAAVPRMPWLRELALRDWNGLTAEALAPLASSGLEVLDLARCAALKGPLDAVLPASLKRLDLRETGAWLAEATALKDAHGLWLTCGRKPDLIEEGVFHPFDDLDWRSSLPERDYAGLLEQNLVECWEGRTLGGNLFNAQRSTLESLAQLELDLSVSGGPDNAGWRWVRPAELLAEGRPAIGFSVEGPADPALLTRALQLASGLRSLIHLSLQGLTLELDQLRPFTQLPVLRGLDAECTVVGDGELELPELLYLNYNPGPGEERFTDDSLWRLLQAPRLTHLRVRYGKLDSALFERAVERFAYLKSLNVENCERASSPSAGLKRLKELSYLADLDLSTLTLDDADLEALHGLEITSLRLIMTEIAEDHPALVALIETLPYVSEARL